MEDPFPSDLPDKFNKSSNEFGKIDIVKHLKKVDCSP
jgi:hypothetical protein